MGVHGECRKLVKPGFLLALFAGVIAADFAAAQVVRESPRDNVRRRQAEQRASVNPYWAGFVLKHEGNCRDAVGKLQPIAERGFGFEDAQTALGECHLTLAGLSPDGGTAPPRDSLTGQDDYRRGLDWLLRAAKAGHFEAQGVIISLYAAGLGPDTDKVEAAKWAHLYLTNPQRLNLGAPVLAADAINILKDEMDRDSWLIGKERARRWVPVYDTGGPLPDAAPDKEKP